MILAAGPEHYAYWDAWTAILDEASYIDKNGNVWALWQDGDCWAVCDALMTDDEYAEFFGQPR
jgi:hypothetical protein